MNFAHLPPFVLVWFGLIAGLALVRAILVTRANRRREQERAEKAAAKATKPRKSYTPAAATAVAATATTGGATAVAASSATVTDATATADGATATDPSVTDSDADDLPVLEEPAPAATSCLAPPSTPLTPPTREDFIAAGKIIPAGAWASHF